MVTFDNNVLCLLLHPDADIPNDPTTGKPIERAKDRISFLVEQLREKGSRILVPAPVLSEFLTFADPEYLLEITQSIWFEIGPFDQRAAIESAVALRRAMKSGMGKKLGVVGSWQKIKIDRQIVAIAKVYAATPIYTTDAQLATYAKESGLETIHIAALPLPPNDRKPMPLIDILEPAIDASNAPEPPAAQSPDDERD